MKIISATDERLTWQGAIAIDGLQTDDYLHPNAKGYKMMGDRLASIIRERYDKFAHPTNS